jgi:hypothetical protein
VRVRREVLGQSGLLDSRLQQHLHRLSHRGERECECAGDMRRRARACAAVEFQRRISPIARIAECGAIIWAPLRPSDRREERRLPEVTKHDGARAEVGDVPSFWCAGCRRAATKSRRTHSKAAVANNEAACAVVVALEVTLRSVSSCVAMWPPMRRAAALVWWRRVLPKRCQVRPSRLSPSATLPSLFPPRRTRMRR